VIDYDDVGEGIPIVFLHGFPHDRNLWAPQLGGLSSQARCIAPDLWGCPPYSMDAYADEVVAGMDELTIDRAVIAGLSMGGYIAFALWRRHPSRVRGLVLAATRPGADTPATVDRRRALADVIRRDGMAAVAATQAAAQLGAATRATRPELVAQVTAMAAAAPVAGVLGAIEAMLARVDSTPTLATIDVPTLVVGGTEDAVITPDELTRMADGIAGSRVELLAGCGHLCNLERPAAFNHVTSEFVATL
jgi:pimeloyl-ACP methyl ester carboxylesterase